MPFKLSKRSLQKLEGVDADLVAVVKRAIQITKVDFGVTCGCRTMEEQLLLVEKGASKTMKSKHLEGKAVDLVAYIGPRITWELNVYDDIANAMKQAASELEIPLRWGGSWTTADITKFDGDMEFAMNSYIDIRRAQGRRPFIDAPHFELA